MLMERFAHDARVAMLKPRLSLGTTRKWATAVELAWHLRQRDGKRAQHLLAEVRIGLSGKASRRTSVLMRRVALVDAELLWLHSRLAEARVALAPVLASDDRAARCDACWILAGVELDAGDSAGFTASMQASKREAEALGDEERSAMADVALAWFAVVNEPANARAHHERIRAWSEHDCAAIRALALELSAALHLADSNHEAYVDALGQAADLAMATGQVRRAILCRTNLAAWFDDCHDADTAMAHFAQALAIARPTRWPQPTAVCLLASHAAAARLGRGEAADELLREAEAVLAPLGDSRMSINLLLARAERSRAAGRPADSIADLRRACELATRWDHAELRWCTQTALAQALVDGRHLDEAITLLDEAACVAAQCGDRNIEVQHLIVKGRVLAAASACERNMDVYALQAYRCAQALAEATPGYRLDPGMLGDAAALHARGGNYRAAYDGLLQALHQRDLEGDRRAEARLLAMQVIHRTMQARQEAEFANTLAQAERRRAEDLQRSHQELEALVARLRALEQELTAANSRLAEASTRDPLTGLYNRRYFEQRIAADVADCGARVAQGPDDAAHLCFYLVDIDHFKQVNDVHGHAAGDAVLAQMRARLQSMVRESDYIVRWGGEEFLVVARGMRDGAENLAERIRRSVEAAPFVLQDSSLLTKTCSVGFAVFPPIVEDPTRANWTQTIDLADQALYVAKRGGRNTWRGVAEVAPSYAWGTADAGVGGGLVEAGQRGELRLKAGHSAAAEVPA